MKLTDELWTQWEKLVYKISKKRLGLFASFGYELDDLVQIGAIGLDNGISNYKDDVECSITTFLYKCIDNEILKEYKSLTTDKRKLNRSLVSIDCPIDSEEKSMTIQDTIEDESVDISKEIEDKLMRDFILCEMKRCLSDCEYKVLYLRIYRNLSISSIGKLLNKSKTEIRGLEVSAKRKLAHDSSYFREKYKGHILEIEAKLDFKYSRSAEDAAIERFSIKDRFNLLNEYVID